MCYAEKIIFEKQTGDKHTFMVLFHEHLKKALFLYQFTTIYPYIRETRFSPLMPPAPPLIGFLNPVPIKIFHQTHT